jgi:hypothetical protein
MMFALFCVSRAVRVASIEPKPFTVPNFTVPAGLGTCPGVTETPSWAPASPRSILLSDQSMPRERLAERSTSTSRATISTCGVRVSRLRIIDSAWESRSSMSVTRSAFVRLSTSMCPRFVRVFSTAFDISSALA